MRRVPYDTKHGVGRINASCKFLEPRLPGLLPRRASPVLCGLPRSTPSGPRYGRGRSTRNRLCELPPSRRRARPRRARFADGRQGHGSTRGARLRGVPRAHEPRIRDIPPEHCERAPSQPRPRPPLRELPYAARTWKPRPPFSRVARCWVFESSHCPSRRAPRARRRRPLPCERRSRTLLSDGGYLS
jgi:hypothetical protein